MAKKLLHDIPCIQADAIIEIKTDIKEIRNVLNDKNGIKVNIALLLEKTGNIEKIIDDKKQQNYWWISTLISVIVAIGAVIALFIQK